MKLSRFLLTVAGLCAAAAIAAPAQGGQYSTARNLVSRVQNDLRRAERFTPPSDKEKERFYNAQHHLSQFDRDLSRGKFDKDKLDEAIDNVHSVVKNNTLSPGDRDTLEGDLRDLRELRARRGTSF